MIGKNSIFFDKPSFSVILFIYSSWEKWYTNINNWIRRWLIWGTDSLKSIYFFISFKVKGDSLEASIENIFASWNFLAKSSASKFFAVLNASSNFCLFSRIFSISDSFSFLSIK